MKRYIAIASWIVLIVMFFPVNGKCLNTEVRGHVSSLFILRDDTGFQHGFLDSNKGVQWRNELQFDLTLKPEYTSMPTYYLEKVFLSYRGAYDAIFELTDRYDNVRSKSPREHELGREDIEWENNLREVFVDLVAEEGMQHVNLRLGRQIVRWGETNLFNIVNLPNPNDNSFQMFFLDPDDLAYPLWMARLNYNITGAGVFDNLGFEFLAIPENKPTILAPLGDSNDFLNTDAPYAFILRDLYSQLNDFGLGNTILKEDVPGDTWENMEYAISCFFSISNLEAALHYFVGHQDTGVLDWSGFFSTTPLGYQTLYFKHPRQRTYGASFNYFIGPLNSVLYGEGAWTSKMHLSGPNDITGFPTIASHNVSQVLLGIQKDLHPKWIGTTSALTWSMEGYWKHIKNMPTDEDPSLYAQDKKNTKIFSMFFMTDYHHGEIQPMLTVAYDTEGCFVTNASVSYDPDGKWKFAITQMSFWGNRTPLSQYSVDGVMQDNSELSFRIYYRF